MDQVRTAGLDGPAVSQLLRGLPDQPAAALDPYLDAAARCFARYGIERTTVQDVAAEMGFNRATIYRQVGTIEQQIRLLAARDVRRHLASLPERVAGLSGPALVVELAAIGVEDARSHPVLAKILADEPRLVGNILETHIGKVRDQVVPVVASLCQRGMDAGLITRMDATVLASWVVRIVVTLIVLEPETELRSYLSELLLPALSPLPAHIVTGAAPQL
ncbi:MAG TPA: TetR/AcrR family transcriptional regulator [Acidimicrobiales bacterium]|jgi:AcrR family transcriptional regulator|nr:TetR/AcrR family transcriptional regulator [Acidimicrobiales bacterium]